MSLWSIPRAASCRRFPSICAPSPRRQWPRCRKAKCGGWRLSTTTTASVISQAVFPDFQNFNAGAHPLGGRAPRGPSGSGTRPPETEPSPLSTRSSAIVPFAAHDDPQPLHNHDQQLDGTVIVRFFPPRRLVYRRRVAALVGDRYNPCIAHPVLPRLRLEGFTTAIAHNIAGSAAAYYPAGPIGLCRLPITICY